MATPEEYAAWIVKNADKKGTPEFETVAQAYQQSKSATPAAVKAPESRDFQEGRAKAPFAQGLAAGANGLLLGFGDEIAGGIGAVIDQAKNPSSSFADNYAANRDTVRGMEAAQRERAPWTTAIAQGVSSVPLMVMAPQVFGAARTSAAAPAVTGVGARALQSAAVGTGYGAIAGAGNSVSSTAADIAADTTRSAVLGGAFGGVGTPVAAAIKAVGGNAIQRMSQTAAAGYAKQKIAEALARDARGGMAAGNYINPLGQIAARFSKLGDEAVVADAGGRNTNQLLDTLATLPGRTKDAAFNMLHQRTAGVGDRMRDAAEKALRTNGQRLPSTVDSLIAQRTQAASPLYTQLRATDVAPNAALVDIIKAAEDLGATKLGKEIATARQLPFSLSSGSPSRWNMGDLDHVKQGIDQVLSSRKALNADGTLTPLGHAYQDLKTKLIGALDDATTNPQSGQSLYRQAREAFGTPSALIDAANAGKLAISRDEASIISTVKSMSGNELEAFRIGAFEGLRNKLGTQGGQTNIMNMWKEPATQEKLRAIFGTERSYREFASSVARESILKRLQSVGTGSQTAARAAGMGDLDVAAVTEAGAAAGALKAGNVLSAIGSAKNAWNRVATPQSVRDQMGQMLLMRGADGRQSLNSLEALVQSVNSRNILLSNGVGVLGAGMGSRIASPALQAPPPRNNK